MIKNIHIKRGSIFVLMITISLALVCIIGLTYAFFTGGISGATNIINSASSESVAGLNFINGSLYASGTDVSTSSLIGTGTTANSVMSNSVQAQAVLTAGSDGAVSYTYNGYLVIGENSFEYTMDSSHPELLVNITKNGTAITSITGLTYVSSPAGFDITGKTGVFQFALDTNITASANNETTDIYTVTIKRNNVGGQTHNQNANTNAKIVGSVVLSREPLTINEVIMASQGGADAITARTTSENPTFGITVPIENKVLEYTGISSCFQNTNGYITYSTDYQIVNNMPEFDNPSTCTYSTCYSSLPGKYVKTSVSSSSTPQANSSSLIHQVTYATSAAATCAIYRLKNRDDVDYRQTGMYKMTDQLGNTYVYRGAVSYNWLKYGDYMWRIVRVNGDGSIRLIYAGPYSSVISDTNGSSMNEYRKIVGFDYYAATSKYGAEDTTTYLNSTLLSRNLTFFNNLPSDLRANIMLSKFCLEPFTVGSTDLSCTTNYYSGYVGPLSVKEWSAAGRAGAYSNYTHSHDVSEVPNDYAYYNYLHNLGNSYWLGPTVTNNVSSSSCVPGTVQSCTYNQSIGVRPVINVNGNLLFSGGGGQITDPYVISTTLRS